MRKALHLIFACLILAGLAISPADGKPLPGPAAETRSQVSAQPYKLYLPILPFTIRPLPSVFGLEMNILDDGPSWSKTGKTQAFWIRALVLDWAEVEPVRTNPATYRWDRVDEAGLRQAAQKGAQVIARVQYTPAWAQKISGYACGPIAPEALDAFAQFLQAAVARYSKAPFYLRYWELGNEPDVAAAAVPEKSVFGCWGDPAGPYSGGGYYAQMLKKAYPAIKAADPRAVVMNGGLLLDCDPEHPLPGNDCRSARFLEGILKFGGGNYLDIINYHGYNQYWSGLQADENHPSWGPRGGVVLGKASFIRQWMAAYQVDKPIAATEGGLLCSEKNTAQCDPPGSAFFEAQADYVVWLYVRNWAANISPTIWYSLQDPGWRYAGMLDRAGKPRPVYYAFQFLTQELSGAKYNAPVTAYSGLQGYEFTAWGKRIWVIWAPDEKPHLISLPPGISRVLDKYGQPIPVGGGQITVKSPVYIELIH